MGTHYKEEMFRNIEMRLNTACFGRRAKITKLSSLQPVRFLNKCRALLSLTGQEQVEEQQSAYYLSSEGLSRSEPDRIFFSSKADWSLSLRETA